MRFKRYKHNLSHYHPFTCDMGQLIPAAHIEVLPGDSIQMDTSALLRVSPLVSPVMHPVEVRLHHWFVPNRLLWSSWEDFITGGDDGNDTSTIPTVAHTATPSNEPLLDYFGIPNVASLSGINALPIRAFNKIYNEFYRDQDLITERSEDALTIPNIAWEKDYFTASRPWTQKGTEVTLPLGSLATIVSGSGYTGSANGNVTPASTGQANMQMGGAAGDNKLYADLSNASAATINDLRLAFATQNYQELRARYGSNYVDYLAYLGITSADARLQRPEYLGGGKQTIAFSEVLATGSEGATTNVGDLAGHGIAALRSNKFTRFFQEHGHLITMMSVRPKAVYSDGLPRKFSRTEKEDYYQRELELIGQQEVLNQEVYASHSTPGGTFSYADRYHEYREEPSRVSGEFRPGESLDSYTLARSFSSDPSLNQTFVECSPSKRIHADTSGPTIWAMCNHRVAARRLVRKNPQPAIL
jgi:hypothetical protein